jgi:hypothetical protein
MKNLVGTGMSFDTLDVPSSRTIPKGAT